MRSRNLWGIAGMSDQQNAPHKSRAFSRLVGMLAGFSFIAAAVSWLLFNDQQRRARVAILEAIEQSSPTMKKSVGNMWRWWRQLWVDPWAEYRQEVAGGASGDVLEVGVGSWLNITRYRNASRLTGVEPFRRQVFAARRHARRSRPDAKIICAPLEALPFPNASFDTVVSSLSLCSVRDQSRALAEIFRVLRPGGTLRFLEHVRSSQPMVAWTQDMLTPFWRLFVGGCHPNRDTEAAILAAGFDIIWLQHINGALGPARPTICGCAQRRPANETIGGR